MDGFAILREHQRFDTTKCATNRVTNIKQSYNDKTCPIRTIHKSELNVLQDSRKNHESDSHPEHYLEEDPELFFQRFDCLIVVVRCIRGKSSPRRCLIEPKRIKYYKIVVLVNKIKA